MLPLTGYRVLACENGLAGPLCSRLLADFGADVVKIERPEGGDVTRGWDTGAKGLSSGFVWVNRGKRSVALDLRREEARSALARLRVIASSDLDRQLRESARRAVEAIEKGEPAALRLDDLRKELDELNERHEELEDRLEKFLSAP